MAHVSSHPIYQAIAPWADELTAIRRDFHQHPEEGHDTARTCGIICEKLREWGVEEIDTSLCEGSVVAVINGMRPGPSVAIRGDMDCLPMPDTCGQPWQSQNPGKAHSCGHDGHATYLLGVARYFQTYRDFPGRVVCVFQPAEEKASGAARLMENGLVEKYDIKEIYGAHGDNKFELGTFGFKVGAMQASCDAFYLKISGHGGHGARPHLTLDPIPTTTEIVNALQTIVSRRVDPMEPAVLSVCSINAGSYPAMNVVPTECTVSGTVRTFSVEVQDLIERKMYDIINHTAAMNECEAEFIYRRLVGPVRNDKEITEEAERAACEVAGEGSTQFIDAYMGSEDFAEYLKKVPGTMIRIGVRDAEHNVGVHNSGYDFNDKATPMAVAMLCNLTLKRLAKLE